MAHATLFSTDSGANKEAEKAAAREWMQKAADLGETGALPMLAKMKFD